ncbi:hypothetical protein Salat_1168400 [Sesamum alatum]|uniref:Uncharacterized protein n=1 Tax=Sesamum alatum TaxID=300844 RepID=A0AAE1YF34_9LAMI|nr:hypothetical protein Salat_1168400 [Sesamum alatum]
MATLARICRRLPRALSTTLPAWAFSAQAAESAAKPDPSSSSHKGIAGSSEMGLYGPEKDHTWWYTTALPCGMAPFSVATLTRLQLGFVQMYRNGVLSTPLDLLLQIGVDRNDLNKVFVQLTLEFLSKQGLINFVPLHDLLVERLLDFCC